MAWNNWHISDYDAVHSFGRMWVCEEHHINGEYGKCILRVFEKHETYWGYYLTKPLDDDYLEVTAIHKPTPF